MSESHAVTSNLPELSVTELATAVKRTMETTFDRVRVRGELGRVTVAKSGHLYADLKDENACISLVMWKGGVNALRFKPAEGLEVIAEGKLSTFPNKSQYQLVCDRMEPAGVGALLAQLERLKAKLADEGLFARERKRPIPFLPNVIGVVTSPTGAVIRDILHRLEERFPRRVILWPVLVQGDLAAAQIVTAIKGFNALDPNGPVPRPDVLIVARGGGSIEDLWAFNEEAVVRAAAESKIPLISAVGHETDTTLIDYASDLRCPTPTAAAERAVPVRTQLVEQVHASETRLSGALVRGVERRRTELRAAAARLPRPDLLLSAAEQRSDRIGERLGLAIVANAKAAQARLDKIAARLRSEQLQRDIVRRRERAAELEARMKAALQRRVQDSARHLAQSGRLLETLSHKSALDRGFALVTDETGALVRRAAALDRGDKVTLSFADGQASAVIGEGQTLAQPAPKKSPPGKPSAAQGSLF